MVAYQGLPRRAEIVELYILFTESGQTAGSTRTARRICETALRPKNMLAEDVLYTHHVEIVDLYVSGWHAYSPVHIFR